MPTVNRRTRPRPPSISISRLDVQSGEGKGPPGALAERGRPRWEVEVRGCSSQLPYTPCPALEQAGRLG